MPNPNGRLCTAVLFGCFTHNATAATLLAQSEWNPEAFCYPDDSNYREYRMLFCDCEGFQGSIGQTLPDCPTDSTMTDEACLAGIKTTTFTYPDLRAKELKAPVPICNIESGDDQIVRDVRYICYKASSYSTDTAASYLCDCNDMDTGWLHEDGPESPKYTRRKGEFVCNKYIVSTYCEYKLWDPLTETYTTHSQGREYATTSRVCGPTTLDMPVTEYSCKAGYYLKDGTTCTECPVADDIDGVTIYETSDMYNTSHQARSCYVSANSFSVSDETGQWTWDTDCHYSY